MSLMSPDVEITTEQTNYHCPNHCTEEDRMFLDIVCFYDSGFQADCEYVCPYCGWNCSYSELPKDIETL